MMLKPGPAMTAATHAELVTDLVAFLDGQADYVCGETRFGRAWLVNTAIPDVIRLRKSYTRVDCAVYEVKASRQDFLSDIRSDKWQDYLPMSSRLYFATPTDGVVMGADEIPQGIGWLARTGPGAWRARVTPRIREFTPAYEAVLALLMAEQARRRAAEHELTRERARHRPRNVRWSRRMAARVKDFEDGRGQVARTRQLRQRLQEITGIALSRWGWVDDVARWAASRADGGASVGKELLGDLRSHMQAVQTALRRLAHNDSDG